MAVLVRCDAQLLPEGADQAAAACKAAAQRNLRNREIGVDQKLLRARKAQQKQIALRAVAGQRFKRVAKIAWTEMKRLRDRGNAQLLRVVGIDIFLRGEQLRADGFSPDGKRAGT